MISLVQRLETKKNRFPPLKEKSIVIASTGSLQYFGCHGKSKKKLEFTFDVEVVNVGTFGGSVVQVNIFITQFCYL